MAEVQYTPDVIARNVKQLGNGVIEVRRYLDGYIRADLSWVWFLCLTAVLMYDFFTGVQRLLNEIHWAVNSTAIIQKAFDSYQDTK